MDTVNDQRTLQSHTSSPLVLMPDSLDNQGMDRPTPAPHSGHVTTVTGQSAPTISIGVQCDLSNDDQGIRPNSTDCVYRLLKMLDEELMSESRSAGMDIGAILKVAQQRVIARLVTFSGEDEHRSSAEPEFTKSSANLTVKNPEKGQESATTKKRCADNCAANGETGVRVGQNVSPTEILPKMENIELLDSTTVIFETNGTTSATVVGSQSNQSSPQSDEVANFCLGGAHTHSNMEAIAAQLLGARQPKHEASATLQPHTFDEFAAEFEDLPVEFSCWKNSQHEQLEALHQFAREFKEKRIKLGYTQSDVGHSLGSVFGSDFSQTTISRFEALNLSFRNMKKLRPAMQLWIENVARERKLADIALTSDPPTQVTVDTGMMRDSSNKQEYSNSLFAMPKRRKKRSCIDNSCRDTLESLFEHNPHPSPDAVARIAEVTNLETETIRIWFSNRRQKQKRLLISPTDHQLQLQSSPPQQTSGSFLPSMANPGQQMFLSNPEQNGGPFNG